MLFRSRDKQIDMPGEVIMAAAEAIDENYDAPNFGIDKSKPAEQTDDGSEPALIENVPEEEPAAEPQPEPEAADEKYVNIQNPEDDEIYTKPRVPRTPQERMQMAIESIERRSKYLDEPNVISDEAVDDIVSQISFFDDDEVGKDEETDGE